MFENIKNKFMKKEKPPLIKSKEELKKYMQAKTEASEREANEEAAKFYKKEFAGQEDPTVEVIAPELEVSEEEANRLAKKTLEDIEGSETVEVPILKEDKGKNEVAKLRKEIDNAFDRIRTDRDQDNKAA